MELANAITIMQAFHYRFICLTRDNLEIESNKNIIQAYKLKGKIDPSGNLVIAEPINLLPGDVEVVIWQTTETLHDTRTLVNELVPTAFKRPTKIKALQSWFQKTELVPSDFDLEQTKWEYLKEKHNL